MIVHHIANEVGTPQSEGEFAYNGGVIHGLCAPFTRGEVALAQCATDDLP